MIDRVTSCVEFSLTILRRVITLTYLETYLQTYGQSDA